jgi:hypothetical protein
MSDTLPVKNQLITLPKIPPTVEVAGEWLAKRDNAVSAAKLITKVADQAGFDDAAIMRAKVASLSDELEKQRLAFGKPFRAADKAIKEAADKAREALEVEKTRINGLMTDYTREVEAKRKAETEAQAEAQAEAVKSNPFLSFAAPQPLVPATAAVKSSFANVRHAWSYEITDPAAVTREFCSPDLGKIREHVNANKEASNIPGVRVFEDTRIASK